MLMTWMLWVKRSILTNQSLRRSTELAMSWLKLRKQYGRRKSTYRWQGAVETSRSAYLFLYCAIPKELRRDLLPPVLIRSKYFSAGFYFIFTVSILTAIIHIRIMFSSNVLVSIPSDWRFQSKRRNNLFGAGSVSAKNKPDYNGVGCRKSGNLKVMVNKAAEFKNGFVIVGDNDAKISTTEISLSNFLDLENAV